MKKLKVLFISFLIVGGLVGGYLGFDYYKTQQDLKILQEQKDEYNKLLKENTSFLEKTSINGIDISGLSIKDANDKIIEDLNSKNIDVYYEGNKVDSFDLKNMNYTLDLTEELQKLLDSQEISFEQFSEKSYNNDITIDLNSYLKVENIDLSNLDFLKEENQIKTEDATLEFNEETKEYEIKKEVYGTEITKEDIEKMIIDALSNGEDKVTLDDSSFVQPQVLSTDESLIEQRDFRNKILSTIIVYDMRYEKVETTKEDIMDFVFFGSGKEVTFNDSKIEEFVKNLKLEYDTFGLSREFTTNDYQTIKVSGGDYGWLINSSKEIEHLKQDILTGETISREPEYLYVGQRRTKDEIGNTYIEINLQKQKLWFYKNGKIIIETNCVTGTKGKHDTPTGVYCLTYKTLDATLSGPGYSSKVTYWMPFNKDIGLHDASWRDNFGGSIYEKNGSHGCVNLPKDAAEFIYENIEDDTPIILY